MSDESPQMKWSGEGLEPVRCTCGSYTWVVVPAEGRSVCAACGEPSPDPYVRERP